MNSRFKIMMVALLAALAVSGVVAGSASASWFVGGSELPSGSKATLLGLATVHGGLLLHFSHGTPSTPILVLCLGPIHFTAAFIQGQNGGGATQVTFLNCSVTTPTNCTLKSTEIKTQAVKATAALGPSAPEDRITFSPVSGKLFTELLFETGTSCVVEEVPISGAVTFGAPKGQNEEVNQPLEGLGSVENNSLEAGGGNKANITGGPVLLALELHSKWSFK